MYLLKIDILPISFAPMLDYFYAKGKILVLLSHGTFITASIAAQENSSVPQLPIKYLFQYFLNDDCICVGQGINNPLEVG